MSAHHRRSTETALKFALDRPFADPEKAARKLLEIANATEAPRGGCIHIEQVNRMFLRDGGTPAEYGLQLAIARGWLWKHESGSYVKFTQLGAELFACRKQA